MVHCDQLKSLEYRIFRKLREKLRNFWSKHSDIQKWTKKHQDEYDHVYYAFLNECNELVGDSPLPNGFDFYKTFADLAFDAVLKDVKLYEMLSFYYIDFLKTILVKMNQDTRQLNTIIFTQKCSKEYTRPKSKLNKLNL